LQVFEKTEKSMREGMPQVMCLAQFSTLWYDAKKHVFWIGQKSSKNLSKSVLGAPREAPPIIGSRVQAIWPPRPGTIIKETGIIIFLMRNLPRPVARRIWDA
jgi:hypothetical protein